MVIARCGVFVSMCKSDGAGKLLVKWRGSTLKVTPVIAPGCANKKAGLRVTAAIELLLPMHVGKVTRCFRSRLR